MLHKEANEQYQQFKAWWQWQQCFLLQNWLCCVSFFILNISNIPHSSTNTSTCTFKRELKFSEGLWERRQRITILLPEFINWIIKNMLPLWFRVFIYCTGINPEVYRENKFYESFIIYSRTEHITRKQHTWGDFWSYSINNQLNTTIQCWAALLNVAHIRFDSVCI